MKRYYRDNGSEFLENGASRLRVKTVKNDTIESHKGRVIKFLAVQEVLRSNDNNPIEHGNVLAISFPGDRPNPDDHIWGAGEPFQVPIKIHLT